MSYITTGSHSQTLAIAFFGFPEYQASVARVVEPVLINSTRFLSRMAWN